MLEPFKILALKGPLLSDETSVSGGTKRVSRESCKLSCSSGNDGAKAAAEAGVEKWDSGVTKGVGSISGLGLDKSAEVIRKNL